LRADHRNVHGSTQQLIACEIRPTPKSWHLLASSWRLLAYDRKGHRD